MLVMLVSALSEVYVILEIRKDGRRDVIGVISDSVRAARFRDSSRCEVREHILNPLNGSYLVKVEKEIAEAEQQRKGPASEY
jgi:hypothetical protein